MAIDLIDIDDIDDAKSSMFGFILWSKMWKEFSINLDAFTWHEFLFCPESLSEIPNTTGVYTFVIKPDIGGHPACSYLMYVGKTEKQNLRKRFSQYLEEQAGKRKPRPKVQYLLRKYPERLYFVCLPLNDTISPTDVENALLKAYLPPCNVSFPAEVARIRGAF